MLFRFQPHKSGLWTWKLFLSIFKPNCLVIGHKQTPLKVSQVQGGVRESEPAALKSSVKLKRHLAFRRARSDALSERDELNWVRVNLQLRDTAWHLSVFDMATCDVDEVIASLAGETDSRTQRDAAFFICCLRALSSRCTSNTLNLLLRRYTPGLLLVELYSELRESCVWVHTLVCVCWWEKHFLESGVCVFFFLFFAFTFLCIVLY